jgi:transglutaminase-like putative cysteine protease
LPIPKNTDTQTLQAIPVFTPHKPEIATDTRFGNIYGVYNIEVKPEEPLTITESFSVSVEPQSNRFSKDFSLSDYSSLKAELKELYLAPTQYTPSADEAIKKLATKITESELDVQRILKRIYAYCVEHLTYGDPIEGLYTAHDALNRRCVDCGGFSTLFVSLCQAVGIPARVVSGFFAGYADKSGMHAWAEAILPDGSTVPVDPSIEHRRGAKKTTRPGGFNALAADRIIFSVGCAIPLLVNGQRTEVDILQNAYLYPANPAVTVSTNFVTSS